MLRDLTWAAFLAFVFVVGVVQVTAAYEGTEYDYKDACTPLVMIVAAADSVAIMKTIILLGARSGITAIPMYRGPTSCYTGKRNTNSILIIAGVSNMGWPGT